MEWIFSPRRTRGCCSPFIVGGLRRGQYANTVSSYQRSFFSKLNFFAFYILITKGSALLIPITSTEIGSTALCPNPVDWQEPFTSLFPYRFFPNNVVVMDLVRDGSGSKVGGEGPNSSNASPPCKFRIGGPDTGVKPGHALLLSLQQRPRPISFAQRCSKVLEFPGRWGDDHGPSLTCVTAEEPSARAAGLARNDELNVNIRTLGQVKWGTGGKLIFDLPFQSMDAPFLIALFKVTSQSGCELQIQQYYWSRRNESWACAKDLKIKLRNNVCGRISCSKQDILLQELKGYPVLNSEMMLIEAVDELELPPNARIRTIGYFLKGLLLPLIISLSATMAYIIWRKRMKAYAAASLTDGVSLGTQTNQFSSSHPPGGEGREEEGVLIQFEDIERAAKDKPPTYESLLEPPSYDQAMSPPPPQHSPCHSHFLSELIDHNGEDGDYFEERHLLLKTLPPQMVEEQEDDHDVDGDKTVALTPTPSSPMSSSSIHIQGPSYVGGAGSELRDFVDELDLSTTPDNPLPPPPPFQ